LDDKDLDLTAKPSGKQQQEKNVNNPYKRRLDSNLKKRGMSEPVECPNKGAG
jgi:hypothetical protein